MRFLRGGLAVLPLLGACPHPPRPEVPPIALAWTPFYWVRAGTEAVTLEHASILFRTVVRPGTPPSLVQLDLAASGGLPEGLPEPADTRHEPRPKGQLYGILGARGRLEIPAAARDSGLAAWRTVDVGTIGLPNYLRHSLVLDFVNARLAVVPDRATSQTLAGLAFAVLPLPRGQYDQVELSLVAPDGRPYRGLLDTGLSPFPLWTTRAVWEQLTGLRGPGPGTRRYRLPNPRGELVFVGARIRSGARLGAWELPRVEAVFLAEAPPQAELEAWRPPVDVLLGPSLFAGRLMVMVDLLGSRVALLRPGRL